MTRCGSESTKILWRKQIGHKHGTRWPDTYNLLESIYGDSCFSLPYSSTGSQYVVFRIFSGENSSKKYQLIFQKLLLLRVRVILHRARTVSHSSRDLSIIFVSFFFEKQFIVSFILSIIVRFQPSATMTTSDKFTEILQLMQTLKEESEAEIHHLKAENAKLRRQLKGQLPGGRFSTKPSGRFSQIAVADAMRFAKNTHALEGLEDALVEGNDGMLLTDSVSLDPSHSSYATGYDYSLLKPKEILVAMHDVGDANKDIDQGPGMWANYILNKE